MPSVRGLALMSRLEYFESKYGAEKYRDFLKKISTEDVNFARQPVDGAHTYPDSMLARIDQILLEDYLENDTGAFRSIGKWSADNFLARYFSLYVEEDKPLEFLAQYARLRESLIGSGEMSMQIYDDAHIGVSIDYGQTIPKSVCLSEQGFLEGSMEQCGAHNVKIQETNCASESGSFVCQFDIKFSPVHKQNK
jgi:predicted hydrocarbon binding protein